MDLRHDFFIEAQVKGVFLSSNILLTEIKPVPKEEAWLKRVCLYPVYILLKEPIMLLTEVRVHNFLTGFIASLSCPLTSLGTEKLDL